MNLSRGLRLFLFLCFCAAVANAQQTIIVPVPVPLPSDTTFIRVDVYENASPRPRDVNVLLLHGFAQSRTTMGPLANALLTQPGSNVARVFVPNLPSQGVSGVVWGFVTLQHYVGTLDGLLDYFGAAGTPVDVLIGHSMGGLIVQLEQQSLNMAGTTLRARHGVRSAILIAPVIPGPLPWALADSGTAAAILGPYVNLGLSFDPRIIIPPAAWVPLFYSDRQGNIPAGAPTPAEAAAAQYGFAEAGFAGFQMIGYGGFGPRLPVDAGAFAPSSGTTLGLITLEQDGFFEFQEHRTLYQYLTGDPRDRLLFALTGPNTVHNMHTFEPSALLRSIRRVVR